MTEPTITCPDCATEIRLTDSLAAPLIAATRKDFEARLKTERDQIEAREALIATERAALAEAAKHQASEVAAKVAALRGTVAAEEATRARQEAAEGLAEKAREVADLNSRLKARDEKLAEAQAAQADALRQARELEDARRELDLTIEKRVGEGLAAVRATARAEAEDGLKLKVAEKEELIANMQRQIEELRRRSEQGSQQLQGEVLELQLEATLRERFPADSIEPVAKGVSGADVLQRVFSPTGQDCGAILWESKRTKNWTDAWVPKLRDDQRAAGATLALLVTQALPKGVETFAPIDGIWVADPRNALSLAVALRSSLIELAGAKAVREGQGTKMELVYDYLTGPRFRHRIEAIVERFTAMQDDLNKERKATQRLWAKRDMQIQGVIEATMGMYGDLQGIAGKAMAEIEGLDTPLLAGADAED